jgi:hypothetical protein
MASRRRVARKKFPRVRSTVRITEDEEDYAVTLGTVGDHPNQEANK